ncbi:MAG TPA: 1-phosphofructokinase family hexose kinase [Pyrinomonadaceae bacterium]|jgi:tagatose 6-phosphate kinase
MILVVSMNPALDVRMSVGQLNKGAVNRIRCSKSWPGGKGIHVASTARALGSEVVMTGLLPSRGAEYFLDGLAKEGIKADFIKVEGKLRTCISLLEEDGQIETELLEPGCSIAPNSLELLKGRIKELASSSEVVVFNGSLPSGIPSSAYAELVSACNELGCQTILDTSGEALKEGVNAAPSMIKPNREEAGELVGFEIEGMEAAYRASRQLADEKTALAVISLGAEGIVVSSSKSTLFAVPPLISVRNPTGSGDCLVGGFAFGLERRLPLEQTIRIGVACGAANAASDTTGEMKLSLMRELESRVLIHEGTAATPLGR